MHSFGHRILNILFYIKKQIQEQNYEEKISTISEEKAKSNLQLNRLT